MKKVSGFLPRLAITLIGIMTMMSLAHAQLTNDEVAVLELAFHQIDMNEQDHFNNQQIPVLVIVDNGVLNDPENFTWFGNHVELKPMQAIIDEDIQAYVVFDSLSVKGDKATIGFSYANRDKNDYSHYIIQYKKSGQIWTKVQ